MLVSGAAAAEPITHLIDLVFFEVVEEGLAPSDRAHIAMNIFAGTKDGQAWADCQWVYITTNKTQRKNQLFLYSASTKDGSIRNVLVNQDTFSFDIALWPDRPVRFVAAGKSGTSNYKIGGAGVWAGLLNKSELVKIEWKQVTSITLPYNTLSR